MHSFIDISEGDVIVIMPVGGSNRAGGFIPSDLLHCERTIIMAEQSVENTTPEAPKKKGVCQKVYIDGEGNETRSATAAAAKLEFRFANGEVRSVNLETFPANINTSLAWFGRSEKLGNFYAGAKGDPAIALEKFEAGLELLISGEWIEKGEGVGTAPSLIVEAIVRALTAEGQTVDDTRRAEIAEKCKDKDTREGAKKDAKINAHIKAITAERAAERAVKAQEAAAEATGTVEGF